LSKKGHMGAFESRKGLRIACANKKATRIYILIA